MNIIILFILSTEWNDLVHHTTHTQPGDRKRERKKRHNRKYANICTLIFNSKKRLIYQIKMQRAREELNKYGKYQRVTKSKVRLKTSAMW